MKLKETDAIFTFIEAMAVLRAGSRNGERVVGVRPKDNGSYMDRLGHNDVPMWRDSENGGFRIEQILDLKWSILTEEEVFYRIGDRFRRYSYNTEYMLVSAGTPGSKGCPVVMAALSGAYKGTRGNTHEVKVARLDHIPASEFEANFPGFKKIS